MCHGENRYGFFVEFDITNSCHLQLAFLEFYPFKEVKYVKSLSFTEFTPTLFYLLSHKLLILNNLQIRFMYPLISLYLIMPVISPWLEKASAKDELIFLGIFAFSTFMPWLHKFVAPELWGECFWNCYHMLWYCSGFIGYLVMAHFVRFHIRWTVKKRLTVGTVCFLAGAGFTAWSFWWKGVPGVLIDTPILEWAWEFCTPNVLCATFGLFLIFTCIGANKSCKLITGISKLSFGIYLMHMFFLAPIAVFFVNGNQANPIVPVYLAIPCIALLTFVCCTITAKLLSYVPGSRRFLGA